MKPTPGPRTRSEVDLIVMGYSAPSANVEAKRRMTEFAIMLGHLAMIDVSMTALPSYERVAQLIYKGEIDLAWLSPIPYISLARRESVVPIVSHHRGGNAHYHGAIIVHASSRVRTLAGLKKARAAWVDRHSASGFVLPRIELWEAGIDPRAMFSSQRFYGSHEAVVRAVAEGRADFGATYVQLAANGSVKSGSWSSMGKLASQVRVLATFGEIPSDVIVARSNIQPKAREIITKAFLGMAKVTQGKQMIQDVFGADDFRKPALASYERLRDAAAGAVEDGLLEIDEDQVDDGSSDRTMEIAPRPRADSTSEADVLEVLDVDPDSLVIPQRQASRATPNTARSAPPRPVAAARAATPAPRPTAAAPRPAAPRPAGRAPIAPRKPQR